MSENSDKSFRLSIAVPVHDEESVLPEFLRRLAAVVDQIPGGPHELVFVDDGSIDGTREILESAAAKDSRFVVCVLSRNFGHQAALSAALDNVSGDAVVVMDADLQDAPEDIPAFIEKFREGYDVVYAQRTKRKEPWWLRLCYKVFYRLISALADVRLPLDAGDFGLMSRRVVRLIRSMPEHHRYLRGLRGWVGFRQIGIHVERDARYAGKSKYTSLRLFKLAFDGILAFSVAPIRAAAILGLVAIGLSGSYTVYSAWVRLVQHRSPQGFAAIITVVTFLSGVQLLFLGVIGEYVGRVFEELKARPIYVVSKVIRGGRQERNSDQQSDHAELAAV
ncbi:MAG: glycosyltransferase family 2 protein [Candidatus Acidiferrales bacterium]|jgi:dolichol-phosphate mannosyltransferase